MVEPLADGQQQASGFDPSKPTDVHPSGFDPSKPTTPEAPQKSWWDSIKDVVSEGTQGIRPFIPGTAEAAALGSSIIHHPIDTIVNAAKSYNQAVNDVGHKAVESLKAGDVGQFVRHGLGYLSGVPRIDEAGNYAQSGEYAKALGATADVATQMALPKIAGEVLPKIIPEATTAENLPKPAPKPQPAAVAVRAAPDLMKAAPPSTSTPYTTADLIRATPELSAQHAAEPVEGVVGARESADKAIQGIQDRVGKLVDRSPVPSTSSALDVVESKLTGKGAGAARSDDLDIGLKELDSLNLDQPMTMRQKFDALTRLNSENDGQLAKNRYDVATAIKSDPAFAARYYAAQGLRDDIYNGLEEQGIPGIRDLRKTQGSLIVVRDAFQRQEFAGEKPVSGSGANSPAAQVTRRVLPVAGAAVGGGAGGYFGGTVGAGMGAGAGAATGRIIAQAITPENLTRDALMARGFKTLSMSPHPVYPEVPTPRGLLNAAPTRLPGSVVTEPESVPPVVGGTSQPYVFGNVKQIGSGRIGEGAEGEVTRERHGPSPFGRTGGPAKAMTVVDPATGQEHLIYLSDVDTEKLHKLILESLKTKDVSGKGK